MSSSEDSALSMVYIGGPTVKISIRGFTIVTDPTFDPAGTEYRHGSVTLNKTVGPGLTPAQVGPVDLVLLSHDQHADNLDSAGREFLKTAARVMTTAVGAGRLGSGVGGLVPWESVMVGGEAGVRLRITATPARHGPVGIEPIAGDVVGFVVTDEESNRDLVYITGDTCWFSGVEEVSRRFHPENVLLFAGAAQTRGPFHLTMDTNDALETAVHFPQAAIVPVHHEDWQHFTQSETDLKKAFTAVGQETRLRSLPRGQVVHF